MKHTIERMKNPLVILDENRNTTSTNGYAFIDDCGSTIIIVYGEGRRDAMSKYLTDERDILKIKYKVMPL